MTYDKRLVVCSLFLLLFLVFIEPVFAGIFNPIVPPPMIGPVGPQGPQGEKGDPGEYIIGIGLFTIDINGSNESILNVNVSFLNLLFNDTAYINAGLSLKLNITDQRYNDTALINSLLNEYYNMSESDARYYPLTSNPAGYLNSSVFNDTYNGTWVKVEGDNMTGNLSMNNNSILNVWELNVHNITGNSPIHISDDVILTGDQLVTGNITVENTVITNVIKGINLTFVDGTTNQTIMTITPTQYPTYGNEFGDLYARTATIDRLIVTGLLNYSETEPPDYYFSDEVYINKFGLNTTFLFVFNETKLNQTIYSVVGNETINFTQDLDDERAQRIANDTYLWTAKLNVTDQRYNDTAYIDSQLLNYYNITEIDLIIAEYYNITEIDGFLALKLNVTDQRYNDTAYIDSQLLNYYNSTEIDGFLALKLNVSDQRYNDTTLILAVNTSTNARIDVLNATKLEFADEVYLHVVNTTVYMNESKLNSTVNNISKVMSYQYSFPVTTNGTTGSNISIETFEFMITQIIVTPTTSGNKYRFQLTEYPIISNVIDADLVRHTGVWNIKKAYSLNSQVEATISNVQIDEMFNVTIKYIKNGIIN